MFRMDLYMEISTQKNIFEKTIDFDFAFDFDFDLTFDFDFD